MTSNMSWTENRAASEARKDEDSSRHAGERNEGGNDKEGEAAGLGEVFVKNVRAMWETALKGLEQRAERQRREKLRQEAAKKSKGQVLDALRCRGVLLGAPLYPSILASEQVDVSLGEGGAGWSGGRDQRSQGVGAGGDVLWPLLFIYQEHQQTDFLRQCREDSCVADHLASVLDPALPPAPWDPQRTLSPASVSVYYISYQAPVLQGGKWVWLREESGRIFGKHWRKIDTALTLREVVRLEEHVIPQFPVLHVVKANSSFEAYMLASDPTDFLPAPAVTVEEA